MCGIACWLEKIYESMGVNVWTAYVIPIAAIVVTAALGIATFMLGHAANKLAKQNTELSTRQSELIEREQRQVYANAVLAHYEDRRQDIREGKNGNMPHYTARVLAAGELVDAPKKRELIEWLTSSIRHVIENGPPHDRQLNSLWFGDTVPVVVARWVRSPDTFEEPLFKLYHERKLTD